MTYKDVIEDLDELLTEEPDESLIDNIKVEILDGKCTSWYEFGQKSREIPYVDGKKHGTAIRYWINGSKKSETPYVDGERHGTEIWYNKDGSKYREIVYENGTKISEKRF